jgi:hypothetical protein
MRWMWRVKFFTPPYHYGVRLGVGIILILLAACQPATPTPEQAAIVPVVQSKLLATVYISPTPDEAEQQATRFADPATPTAPPPTAPPTETPYVGVFLGEAVLDEGEIFNPGLLTTRPPLELPTIPPGLVCAIPTDPIFGTAWSEDETVVRTLGCALEASDPFIGSLQIFENGVMYFRNSGEIWAIAPGEGKYWFVPQAPSVSNEDVLAPDGLRVPTMGFGGMWRGVDGVRQALGFARLEEQAAPITLQPFQNGTLLHDGASGQNFVLLGDGTAYGPY